MGVTLKGRIRQQPTKIFQKLKKKMNKKKKKNKENLLIKISIHDKMNIWEGTML